MRNRILCLVLAICMVVLAVPAFVLPMTAASTQAFKTTFGKTYDSWPTSDGKVFTGFPTEWEAGYFDYKGEYHTYSGLDAGFNILNAGTTSQWSFGGIYLDNTRYILTGNTNPFDNEWKCTGCDTKYPTSALVDGKCPKYHETEAQNNCYKEVDETNAHGKPTGNKIKQYGDGVVEALDNTTRIAFVMNYVSPYEGVVDLGLESFLAVSDQAEAMDYFFAIFLNGEMIWPTADGDFDTVADWAVLMDSTMAAAGGKTPLEQFAAMDRTAITDLAITRGDNIQFAIARKGANYVYAEPSVSFDAGYLVVPTTMKDDFAFGGADWPKLSNGQGVRTFKQTSERWQFGDVDADGAFTPFVNYFRQGTEAYACHGGQDYAENGAVMLSSGVADLRGGILFGTASTYSVAYQYTALATGKITPSIANMKLLGEDADSGDIVVADSGSVSVKIYKNGELLDTVTATATADGVSAEWPADVAVVRGDKIIIAVAANADLAGVGGTASAAYTELDSFMTETTEEKYALKLENGTAIFGDKFGVTFYTYATADVYNDYREAGIYVWKSDVAAADRTPANAEKIPATLNNAFAFEADYDTLVAKEMADVVAVQSYVVVNDGTADQTITSEVYEKSVAQYVMEQYNATDDAKLQKVLVAMLNYGAYAQTFFNYNTENLANAEISESLREMDEEILYYAQFDAQKGSTNNICNTEISAFALSLNNTVDLKVYIKVDPTESGSKMQIQVAETKEDLGTDIKVDINEANPVYIVEDIGLTELSKTFYFRVTVRYGPTLYYGYVFSYSVESYAARMVDSTEPGLSDLVRSMMEFSKAINAYNA